MISGRKTTQFGGEVGVQIFEIMKEAFVQKEYNVEYIIKSSAILLISHL